MRIFNAKLNNKNFNFLKEKDLIDNNNKYTIILGENGTGKSELLRQIINNLLRIKILNISPEHNELGKFSYRDLLDSYLSNKYKSNLVEKSISTSLNLYLHDDADIYLSYEKSNSQRKIKNFKGEEISISDGQFRHKTRLDSHGFILLDTILAINIIAISESIHIKFPIIQDDSSLSYYYPGHLKESDSDYFFSNINTNKNINQKEKSIILSILLASLRSENIDLKSIFDLLKFDFKIKIDVNSQTDIDVKLKRLHDFRFNSIGIEKISNFNDINEAVNWYSNTKSNINEDIFKKNIQENYTFFLDLLKDNESINYLYHLISYNLIDVSNIYFYKSSEDLIEIPIQDMSSGQLCLISSFSSIAAHIRNGSLIFIDEPEISLHPLWASQYIELLQNKFSSFQRCHFLIATHSPHIVSNLPDDNAYVITIKNDGTSKCIESNVFNFKSVDFQLAEIFDFPGNRNEYLIRVIMVILTKISENESLNVDDLKTIDHLKQFIPKLKPNDPVKHLINQISVLTSNEQS